MAQEYAVCSSAKGKKMSHCIFVSVVETLLYSIIDPVRTRRNIQLKSLIKMLSIIATSHTHPRTISIPYVIVLDLNL